MNNRQQTAIETSKVNEAMALINQAAAILKELTDGIETDKREVYEITKYESGSGNTTWKADCEDGTRVYFRQAQRSLYEEVGIWDWLNELEWDSTYGVAIHIETIPDGDFHKIVNVSSWEKSTDSTPF